MVVHVSPLGDMAAGCQKPAAQQQDSNARHHDDAYAVPETPPGQVQVQ
jgi:hypothetical protein